MAESGNWREYIRTREEFDVDTLCDYADHIIFSQAGAFNIDHETEESRVSWNSEDADVAILKRKVTAGTFMYRFGVHDKAYLGDDADRVYLIPSRSDKVTLQGRPDERGTDSQTHAKDLMRYLRTNRGVPEPRLDKEGRQLFRQIAAGVAVEAAMERKLVDVAMLDVAYGTSVEREVHARAVEHTLAQTIEAEGLRLAYTQSETAISHVLGDWLSKYRATKSQPRSIEQRKLDP